METDLPPKPSRESLVALCRDEPEKAADLILMLWDKVEKLAAVVEAQGREIAGLKAKLAKNRGGLELFLTLGPGARSATWNLAGPELVLDLGSSLPP